MEFRLDNKTVALLTRLADGIEHIAETLDAIQQSSAENLELLMDVLTQLESEVATNTTLTGDGGSVATLLGNVVTAIQAADPNNKRVKAVLDTLTANDVRLAALAAQGTPVAVSVPPPVAVATG